MKQLMKNACRFVSEKPRVGSVLVMIVWSLLIVFCLFVWCRSVFFGEMSDDTILFLKRCFFVLFVLQVVASGAAFAQIVLHWILGQSQQLKSALCGVAIFLGYVVMTLMFVGPFACLVYEKLNPEENQCWTVQCANINDPVLGCRREKAVALLPRGASDIYISCDPGCLAGGGREFFRCKVTPNDLRVYIKERGYNFRLDSTQVNENGKCPYGCPGWPNEDGTSLLGSKCFRGLCDVDEYWSYNYIYTNNGGYRMFYDVKRQLFYYSWSAN